MSEMRMLIVPAHLVKKIDENRGDLTQGEFLDFLLDSQLKGAAESATKQEPEKQEYVTREALQEFEHGMRELLRNFLDFVVMYGLELGKGVGGGDLDALSRKLQNP